MTKTHESSFQKDVIEQMLRNGWVIGQSEHYDRERAMYTQDTLSFIQTSQPQEWEKFAKVYPNDTQRYFLDALEAQLKKAEVNIPDKLSRSYGTLGVLRHGLKIRNARFSLCQFKPEHDLNPQTQARYQQNICRIVPELVYSPYATAEHLAATGTKSKRWRIDLVLFMNGLPIITLELKSEFKQTVQDAITQYKQTRLPKDVATKKPEPLLSFKRGALVHFALSQYEVFMSTKLEGANTFFLPFNKGTQDGGAGNDIPADTNIYATAYLWDEVLQVDNLLNILGSYMHLNIEEKEDWQGIKTKKESMIFPRYHQWDVVRKLINAAKTEGLGHKYLIQHSAGSGKSNSIAWCAHQLSSLYDVHGHKLFDCVIVVTDRTVLDDQLQETIYQFEHADGVVGRINHKEGAGSKSEKLAQALEKSQAIIIVTIQTFPHVLKAIEDSKKLKQRRYAVIADEAHSSQTGTTAKKLKDVLINDYKTDDNTDNRGDDESAEDVLNTAIQTSARNNLNYYAFTATPKAKTIELFGRVPDLNEPPSKTNKPESFHVYSMRQAIEEGFILDVLKNYITYKVAYKLVQKIGARDKEVDSKKAKRNISLWVSLHDYNIASKVKVILEHYISSVMPLLGGQAKAMVVTRSRKEAVRYKLAFDKYISTHKCQNIQAMVAFSGEVEFNPKDKDSAEFLNQKFTEHNMNAGLKGRDMRKAFDSVDYQVMLVANKFQTGFDQPKLCAMYVDKPLGGVECVQTLSRLNRTYKGKEATFVLDFCNEPEDILNAFLPYYQTAKLLDVSDPNLVFDLFDKLRTGEIFLWTEVAQFYTAFYSKTKSNAVLSNICKLAKERWELRYQAALVAYKQAKEIFERTKKTQDAVLIANAENDFKESGHERSRLEIFKKDLGSFVRFYEFMSQITDYDNPDLDKLSLYARHLRPLLHEENVHEDDVDLDDLEMSHYRLAKIREQQIKLQNDPDGHELEAGNDIGTAKPKDKNEDFMSHILMRLNEIFITDNLSHKDMINYAISVRDKLSENQTVMTQIANNTREQAMLGDFPKALDAAVLDSSASQEAMKNQYLSNPALAQNFARVVFDMLNMA